MKTGKRRTNGFERPFHCLQVLAWILYAYFILAAVLFHAPLARVSTSQITILSAYIITQGLVIGLWIVWTAVDTSDTLTIEHQLAKQNGELFDMEGHKFRWTYWEAVAKEKSKHWGTCNKCTDGFDHHWVWLNNCIGKKNYVWFFILIIVVEVCSINLLILWIMQLYSFYDEIDVFSDQIEKQYGENLSQVAVTFWFLSGILNSIIALANMPLIIFHIWIQVKGVTTFEVFSQLRKEERVWPDRLILSQSDDEQERNRTTGIGTFDPILILPDALEDNTLTGNLGLKSVPTARFEVETIRPKDDMSTKSSPVPF